jgi:transporter family protein
MDPVLGGVLLQFVAAILGSLLYIIKQHYTGTATLTSAATWTRAGVTWSIAAGVAVGMAEMLSFHVSARGVQAMQSIPVIIGGSVLLGTVLGSVWLKETISWKGWMGVALISAGIALVGMDPGASMH